MFVYGGFILLIGYSLVQILTNVGGNVPQFELGDVTVRIEKGKDEISKIQQRAMLPKGTCWKAALEDLQMSCKGMLPENQSRLAFKFTTCYNLMLGFPAVICNMDANIRTCMQKLDANSQATFREFFLHTQDMCYFIEHQLWQEKTSNAVNEVTSTMVDVTKNLEEAKETQEKVLQSQQESLKVQSNIIKDNSEIYNMVLNVKDVFEDVQTSALEQRQVIVDVFEKLSRMQKLVSWIQGEMSLLDMMGFYFASMLFGFFGTSSKRTQAARFWVVVLLIITLGLERYLFNCLNSSDANYSPELIQEYVWNLRRLAAIFGVLVIVCAAAYYRDPVIVQQNMLTMVNNRLDKITAHMQHMQKCMDNSMTAIEGPMANADPNSQELTEDSDSDSGSDTDTFSNYSNGSDSTYVLEPESRPSVPTIPEDSDEENEENKIPETDPRAIHSLFQQAIQIVKGRNTRQSPSDKSIGNESRHSYNLRARIPSPNTSTAIGNETSTEFAMQVKHMNRKSSVNRPTNYYSSDDDM